MNAARGAVADDELRRSWRPQPTLPGRSYHADEIWEAERDAVFAAAWICVGREEEVSDPAEFMVRDVVGESVLIVRSSNGSLRAFYNVCAHRGTRLCDGGGRARSGVFVCPYHAWSYDTEGHLAGAPNVRAEEGFDRSTRSLWPIAVDAWDGLVFVNLAPEPEALASFLARSPEGDPRAAVGPWRMGDLRVAHRIEYDVAANWKILVENYSECLHCPTIHPELVRLVPLFRKGLVEGNDGASLAEGATTLTSTGRSSRPPLPGLERRAPVYLGNHIYPTLMINLHSDCVMTYRLDPIGARRTRVVSEFLFHPDTIARDDFDPGDIVAFWDVVSRQDWTVCERAQLGVTSRAYDAGGVYPYNDHSIVDFNERYRAAMGMTEP